MRAEAHTQGTGEALDDWSYTEAERAQMKALGLNPDAVEARDRAKRAEPAQQRAAWAAEEAQQRAAWAAEEAQ
jgi:hypothetical protein